MLIVAVYCGTLSTLCEMAQRWSEYLSMLLLLVFTNHLEEHVRGIIETIQTIYQLAIEKNVDLIFQVK